MEHHFKIEDAKLYGIEKAIILYNIRFWLEKNKANNTNLHTVNGVSYWWTFNSAKAFNELFPYMKQSSIQRWLKELEDDGILIVGSFNKKKYDKTKWYTTLDYIEQTLDQNDLSINQNEQPIPDNKQQIVNTDIPIVTVDVKTTLPEGRGKTPTQRLLTIYKDCFKFFYGFDYKPNFGRDLKILKELNESYSELQLARMLTIFFNWHGMTGSDDREFNFLSSASFSLSLFKVNITKYEVYARNILKDPFDDDEQLLVLVGKHILSIKPDTNSVGVR